MMRGFAFALLATSLVVPSAVAEAARSHPECRDGALLWTGLVAVCEAPSGACTGQEGAPCPLCREVYVLGTRRCVEA